MLQKRKFQVGAWVFTVLLTLVLSSIIGGFYYKNLPLDASLPYFGAVAFLATVSIWLTKYHDEPGEPFTKASFVWKCVLLVMMACNAAFCFHLGRSMGVARSQTAAEVDRDKEFRANLVKQSETAGPRGKLELAKMLREYEAKNPVNLGRETAAFKELETPAFWIMLAEFLLGGACVLCMMGLMIFGKSAPAAKGTEQDKQPEYKPIAPTQDATEHERFQMAQGQWTRPPLQERPRPVGEDVLAEIRALIGSRTQKEIREDAPPRLPNSEWRRWVDGWALIENTPTKNEYRYVGFLDYQSWQELKESALSALPPGVSRRYPSRGEWDNYKAQGKDEQSH